MDPEAVQQTVQHKLPQQLQDLLVIDGEAQSGKETGHNGRRDQGNNPCFASEGKQDEEEGCRPSFTSQGYDKCIGYWMCEEEKIGRKGSNNKVNDKGSDSGGRKLQAVQIEESVKETAMEEASVCT